jgi:hypothetical protein
MKKDSNVINIKVQAVDKTGVSCPYTVVQVSKNATDKEVKSAIDSVKTEHRFKDSPNHKFVIR